ncbi:MAG TPA: GlsB/YeaQ/YmgE family stress response membrane protein [Ignavibacteriaceae bacterium]|nr:GlsB/YeaQ/YmgE family stress response membrane protein [Ignavibacteriaceae bacterium]
MSFLDIVILLVIAGLTGSIARSLVGFDKGGCLLSVAVGFIGALIGTWLARELNFPDIYSFEIRGITYPVVWSLIGAVLFTALLSLISPKKQK